MNIICKKTVFNCFDDAILFTEGNIYEFVPVDNRYTKVIMKDYNFIGYVKKDDEGFKRWIGKEFKNKYFKEVI